MKKLLGLILSGYTLITYADSMVVGQYTFNGMLNNTEMQELEQNIQQNSANKVVITFNGPMILLANDIKNALTQQSSSANVVMQNLVNASNYYYGVSTWYSYNVEVTVYASDSNNTQPNQNQATPPQSTNFYNYKTKDNDFYDYDNTPQNQN